MKLVTSCASPYSTSPYRSPSSPCSPSPEKGTESSGSALLEEHPMLRCCVRRRVGESSPEARRSMTVLGYLCGRACLPAIIMGHYFGTCTGTGSPRCRPCATQGSTRPQRQLSLSLSLTLSVDTPTARLTVVANRLLSPSHGMASGI